jgi:hypothetical protein
MDARSITSQEVEEVKYMVQYENFELKELFEPLELFKLPEPIKPAE